MTTHPERPIVNKLDRFAALIADGAMIAEAADMIGEPKGAADAMLRKMRADLGWQAK